MQSANSEWHLVVTRYARDSYMHYVFSSSGIHDKNISKSVFKSSLVKNYNVTKKFKG